MKFNKFIRKRRLECYYLLQATARNIFRNIDFDIEYSSDLSTFWVWLHEDSNTYYRITFAADLIYINMSKGCKPLFNYIRNKLIGD